MPSHLKMWSFLSLLALTALACGNITLFASTPSPARPTPSPAGVVAQATATPAPGRPTIPFLTSTPLPDSPTAPVSDDPNEPVLITGEIPFTSPFFLESSAEPFVLLEDEAGFVTRNLEFEFTLESQTIGPVERVDEDALVYTLPLPSVPRGTYVDVNNDGGADQGVQVFAVAYWSNTWGDPFLEPRDGGGWSTAYTSAIADPDRDYEIVGGTLVVWAPNDEQEFPTGFGDDGLLFTEDDPVAPIPAGYNLVNLDEVPFRVYKEAQPVLDLLEGEVSVNDFSNMSYTDAFAALYDQVSREYPFTEDKNIDWQVLYDEFAPRVAGVTNDADYYRVIRDFAFRIPDGHVGGLFNQEVFFEERGGGFGLLMEELSDGRVLVTDVLPDTVAAQAGIEVGAKILEWDGQSIGEAITGADPYVFGSYSTEHAKRQDQIIYLTRMPVGTQISIRYQNPGGAPEEITLVAELEVDSLLQAILPPEENLNLPVEGQILPSGFGYIKISSFLDDTNLTARIWERYVEQLIDNDVPGLILDLRYNGGGSGGLAIDFAGYFFDKEIILSQHAYYNDETEKFEYGELPARIEPAPLLYAGPIAVLVSPNCVSACEGFAYSVSLGDRAVIVGHFPTAGAYGEVGRGQYSLPGDLDLQIPAGRPETPEGQLLIEGTGVVPDIVVPVTEDEVLGRSDPVLDAAIEALFALIGR